MSGTLLSPPLLAMFDRKRIDFWAEKGRAKYADEAGSPFMMLPFVAGRDVMEIGPGEGDGRQRKLIEPCARSYIAVDICGRPGAWVIPHYGHHFGVQVDLVFFWCVLHHVPSAERAAFAGFCARHLRPGGLLWFNAPVHAEAGCEDGMGTTAHPDGEVVARGGSGKDIYLMRRVS